MTTTVIDSFTGEHFFLSNFYEAPIDFGGGLVAKSGEHVYQAMKTEDLTEALAVLATPTAGESKKLGRKVTMRPDWDAVKDEVMEGVLHEKFAPGSELARKLMDTGDAILVEGNHWGDTYWGVCNGKGINKLGQLLMNRRDELVALERQATADAH